MVALITVNLNSGQAEAYNFSISFINATIVPDGANSFSVAMASILTNIVLSDTFVTVSTATEAKFTGSINIPIAWTDGQTPQVTLTNLSSMDGAKPSNVTWPQGDSTGSQVLSSGVPVTLSNIAGS